MTITRNVTDEKLQSAYLIIAGIVKQHGEKYLPIFKRMHEEIEVRKAQKNLLEIASRLAE